MLEVGYSDINAFGKVFRNHTAMTPKADARRKSSIYWIGIQIKKPSLHFIAMRANIFMFLEYYSFTNLITLTALSVFTFTR